MGQQYFGQDSRPRYPKGPTVYTFEQADGTKSGYSTGDARHARDYAWENSLRVIADRYDEQGEWTRFGSGPVYDWDFSGWRGKSGKR